MKNDREKSWEENFGAMGTTVSVEIVLEEKISKEKAEKAIGRVREIFSENEKIFSRFDPESELSKINKNIGKEMRVSTKMLEVLGLCLKFHEICEGYFDPRVIENLEKIGYDRDFGSVDFSGRNASPKLEKIKSRLAEDLRINFPKQTVLARKRIDTTGIAKGYTVDEAAEFLRKEGFENFVVDAGGDMFAEGLDENQEKWKIGIEGLEDERIMLQLSGEGIATSGISQKRWAAGGKKYHHLINPKDPEKFSHNIKTVTVVEKKTVEADGRAKVLVLMGKEKGLKFANENKMKALFLDYRGNVYLSEGIKDYVI